MRRLFACAAGVLMILGAVSSADGDRMLGARPWARTPGPTAGPGEVFGHYRAGCVKGAQALPADGEGYVLVRPQRRRHFGHPALIRFIQDYGRRLERARLGVVAIGDLSQPRGGPMPSDHATHQTGLDVDIYYREPRGLPAGRLTYRQRRRIIARPIVSARTKRRTRFWERRVPRLLKLAARDRRVSRIYVNPVIKREMCRSAGFDRSWLRKLVPWWGHVRHFHLRLECPAGSSHCHRQDPLPPGDGCAEADWWLNPQFRAFHIIRRRLHRQRTARMPALPAACRRLLRVPPRRLFRRTVTAPRSRHRRHVPGSSTRRRPQLGPTWR